jgi:hypothetical protein
MGRIPSVGERRRQVVSTNGGVTECSGRLGFNDWPGLECKTIGVISVPTTGGLYHL